MVKHYLQEGRPADAERVARVLLQQAEKTSTPDSLGVADVLDQLAVALRRLGKAAEPGSRELCERAVRIRERNPGPDSTAYAFSLQNLGALLLTAGNYEGAREPLERAAELRERALGQDAPDVATSWMWLATLHDRTGDPAAAEPLVRRALEIRTRTLGPRDPLTVQCMDVLAAILMKLGDFIGSELLFEKELEISKQVEGGDQDETNHNLAVLLELRGDFRSALARINEALRLRIARLGKDHPLVASDMSERGYILDKLGDVQGARKDYVRALEINQDAFGEGNPRTAHSQMNLGLFCLDQGDTARAKSLLQAALVVQGKTLGDENYELAWTLSGLAEIASREGDHSQAEAYCRRSLDVRERALGPAHPDVALSLSCCASVYSRAGQADSALLTSLRAADVSRMHLQLTARALSERQALAYSATITRGVGTAIAVVAGPPSYGGSTAAREVWDSVIQSRTLVLDEMASRQHAAISQEGDTTLARDLEGLESARQRLSNLLVRGPGEGSGAAYPRMLQRAREELDRAERRLASASLAYREEQSRRHIGYTEVAGALGNSDALVAYVHYVDVRATKRYVAFVAASGAEPVAIPLGRASEIDALVSKWSARVALATTDQVASGEVACRKAGENLRRRIWDPIAGRVANSRRVFIVPDGSLYRVSFAGLPAGDSKYMVETGPVLHYLTSERDLVRPDATHREGTGLLALGGPTFGGAGGSRPTGRDRAYSSRGASPAAPSGQRKESSTGDCPDFRTVQFAPLPETALEAKEVAALWSGPGSAIVLTGASATEAEFKRDAPGRRVLHLATHGFFLGSECTSESDRRGIGGVSTGAKPAQRPHTPLQLSGFALAGANSRNETTPGEEDGVLTAEEVASLNLSTVDLAVLSACDTGLGEIQVGEGVLGLRRAFQVAGVRTTVMSLWEVEDKSTREWMKGFYDARFREGEGIAESVREASLSVLHERRAQALSTSPFYWAAFVAAGDWN